MEQKAGQTSMADGMNKAILLGNIGADPELRFTGAGVAVLNFRIATSESWMDKGGEKKERTDWHTIVVWEKRAEGLARILKKGERVAIEGRIQTSSYDDKDGQKRYKTEIVASNVYLCGGRGGGDAGGGDSGGRGGAAGGSSQKQAPADDGGSYGGDDIPF
jgi:single-strand DNA-binding protein